VYSKSAGSWTLGSTLAAPSGQAGDDFGQSVDVSGDWIVVGASGTADNQGAAYAFHRSGTSWTREQTLTLSGGAAGDYFGFAVALDGRELVVGAYGRNVANKTRAGEAFAYGLKDGQWRLETAGTPALSSSDAYAGDNVGYAVAISGGRAMLGAPQRAGRLRYGATSDTDGADYVFLRHVSDPITVIWPERVETLIQGAQANQVSGTLGGTGLAKLYFFDVPEVTIETGAEDDTVVVGPAGVTAYGLQRLTIETGGGENTLTVNSTNLKPPAVGQRRQTGDFGDAEEGDDLPAGAGYDEISGYFRYDGSGGASQLIVAADADWLLDGTSLSAGAGQVLELVGVDHVGLTGGAAPNQIRVRDWNGTVAIDGNGGADRIEISLHAGFASAVVTGDGNAELTLLGTVGPDSLYVGMDYVLFNGSPAVAYTGIAVLRLAGGAGDDTLEVGDSSAARVILDGEAGSDTYRVFVGSSNSDAQVQISDSGPPPTPDSDTLEVPNPPGGTARFVAVGDKTVSWDSTIETLGLTNVTPVLSVQGTAGSDEITLSGNTLTIGSFTVNLTTVVELTIDGLAGDNTFFIGNIPAGLSRLTLIGGGDSDTLFGPPSATTWYLNGLDQGTIGTGTPTFTFTFSGMENLTGGAGADTFVFQNNAAALTGNLDGGGGTDTLDYTARSTAVTVNLATGAATGIGGFANIEQVVGGTGTDTLTGPNTNSTWNVTGNGDVTISNSATTFSSFENLTGGTDTDTLNLTVASGAIGLDQGGFTFGGRTRTPTGFENLNVQGGGNITIGAIQFPGTVSITTTGGSILDGADDNTVDITAGGGIVLTASGSIAGPAGTVDSAGRLELADGSQVTAHSQSGHIRLAGPGSLTLTSLVTDNGSIAVTAVRFLDVRSPGPGTSP